MNRGDLPATITGLLTGEYPKPFKPQFVRAVLRCAFLAAPMLTLLLTIGAYQLDQRYRVITSFRVQTQFGRPSIGFDGETGSRNHAGP